MIPAYPPHLMWTKVSPSVTASLSFPLKGNKKIMHILLLQWEYQVE